MPSDDAVAARFNHVGVSVADLEAQRAWYGRAFGFEEVVAHDEFPDRGVRLVLLQAANGIRIELIERRGSKRDLASPDPMQQLSLQGYAHLAVSVDDLDEAWSRLLANGAQPKLDPASTDASHGQARFGYIADPEGNLVEVIEDPR